METHTLLGEDPRRCKLHPADVRPLQLVRERLKRYNFSWRNDRLGGLSRQCLTVGTRARASCIVLDRKQGGQVCDGQSLSSHRGEEVRRRAHGTCGRPPTAGSSPVSLRPPTWASPSGMDALSRRLQAGATRANARSWVRQPNGRGLRRTHPRRRAPWLGDLVIDAWVRSGTLPPPPWTEEDLHSLSGLRGSVTALWPDLLDGAPGGQKFADVANRVGLTTQKVASAIGRDPADGPYLTRR